MTAEAGHAPNPAEGPQLSVEEQAGIQRRTLVILCAGATFSRAGMAISFAVAALVIKRILDDETWAGASTAAITVGTALSASALSNYMNRKGRRPGLVVGTVVAIFGALVAVLGGEQLILPIYLAGLVGIGVGQGASNLARYAAADLAAPERRSTDISWVVFASTIGAVGGPALVGPAGDVAESFGLHEQIGPFLFSSVFFAVGALIVWAGLRPDPLVLSGGLQTGAPGQRPGFVEGWRAVMASSPAQLAVVGLVVSQGVMVMVMAMTPLHMDAHGHELDMIGYVLSAHTAGMFAPAPIAGWASDRFGRLPALAAGATMLIAATVMTALAGEAPAILMFPGLFLLGLGWSFGMVASSALLTESVDPEAKVAAQGAADLVTSLASGVGALASGFVFGMAGFHVLSMIGIVASGMLLILAFYRQQVAARLV